MSRRRSLWIALAAAAILLGAYVARRRRTPALVAPAPTEPLPVAPVATPAVEPPLAATVEAPSTAEGHVFFDDAGGPEPRDHDETGRPLPTWVRASVVVAALIAFFAVSLIATKQL